MQENRSFDHYFGTFPGADGLPRDAVGNFTSCVPVMVSDPSQGCVKPFHDTSLFQAAGPHSANAFVFDLDDGAMNGFVEEQERAKAPLCRTKPKSRVCAGVMIHDVMGYHTAAEIPNYWEYATRYLLQDHFFEPVGQWSGGAHLMMTSEWAAKCRDPADPMSCASDANTPPANPKAPRFAWTSLAWLLDQMGVSWRYYLSEGGTPDCDDQSDRDTCDPEIQESGVYSPWNPLPGFTTFAANVGKDPRYARHVIKVDKFYADITDGKLATVSWIIPSFAVSEHPGAPVVDGMNYVTSLVNAIMQSPYYNNTVIFIAWDDWGGFYDHAAPPVVDLTEKWQLWVTAFACPAS
jgi:phospholipase C